MSETEPPQTLITLISRAANEGVPVGAIARIVHQEYEEVAFILRGALCLGHIGEMPKADWPPAAKWSDRLPSIPRSANGEDVEFQCRRTFHLTNLEVGFMVVILRSECADKDKLHNVIEQRRAARATRVDSSELTDPKMVDVMICKLRKKLRDVDPVFVISTSWGKGYYFEAAVKQKIFAMIGGSYAPSNECASGD
jgi:hypothetical protein